ncbi:hypothetical protein VKT23_011986 [Stygiomarasmius scandens]|uniref:AA9 family lytic polysaccharide monooxygenase n=1 Tax=Marasmiellus scandens TaxID=2682957 RepID=A0ABR1JA63_9AGAR
MLSTAALAFGLLAPLLPLVQAHGQIKGVMANGVYNTGPNIYWDGDSVNDDTVTRKMYQASSPSYLNYWDFSDNEKMACEGADPAPKSIDITAGSGLTISWQGATSELLNKAGTGDTDNTNPWVHAMGLVTDYIASCNGDCSSFSSSDAGNAGWTKLATFGLDTSQSISDDLRTTMANKPEEYYPTADEGQGLWGMAKLVEDSSSWTVTIPSDLESGQYLIRHELAAVHSPKSSGGGPQLYVACIQVNVVDGGSTSLPEGTQAGSLYETDGYLANYDVYTAGTVFEDIGPAIWDLVSGVTDALTGSSSSSTSVQDASTSTTKTRTATSTSTQTAAEETEANTFTNTEVAFAPTTTSTSSTAAAAPTTTTTDESESDPETTSSFSSTFTSAAALSVSTGTRQCKTRSGSKRSIPAEKRALKGHRQMKRRLEYDSTA